MSEYDRGAYTPPNDQPLSFDARRPVRGGSPISLTVAISALVLVVLGAGAVFLYRDGMRGQGEAPKAVGNVVAQNKTAPAPEAQPAADPAEGLQILSQKDGDPEAPPAATSYAPAPEQPDARPLPRPTIPTEQATLPPAQAAPPPVKPAPRPVEVASNAPKPTAPVAPPKPATLPKPASTPVAGSVSVQIGAFSSAALAEKGWREAASIAPGDAAGKGKRVEPVDRNGSTLYRTSVTGFASKVDAALFCDKLKSAGKSCFVK